MSNNLLKGKKGIISGALDSNSIAWKVAEKCVEQGAEIILTNAPIAMRMGAINELSDKLNSPIIPCDFTDNDQVIALVEKSKEHFGGKFDFLLHSIGMSLNVRKGRDYTNLKYDWTHKTYDISCLTKQGKIFGTLILFNLLVS